jgi:hypothetical protein
MVFPPSQVWASAVWVLHLRPHDKKDGPLDWTETVFRVIDLATFSSVWFWLAVIVSWAVASHWLIGVPFDLLYRARKSDPQELADLEAITDVNVRRFTGLVDMAGPWLLGLVIFILTTLGMAGFYYGLELAQGLFILGAPLTVIMILNILVAQDLRAHPLRGSDLVHRMFRLRIWSQAIGMIAIFFTAVYGMWFNLDALFAL